MDWNDLRYFMAVAAAGSLSAAAQNLRVNTTTVLRRVGRLESLLDQRLFERARSGYHLTAAGQRLVEALDPVEQRLNALERDVLAGGSGSEGVVRLTAGETVAGYLLAPAITQGTLTQSGVIVDLMAESFMAKAAVAPRIMNPLLNADIAVRTSRPTQGDILVRKIGVMAYGLYGTNNYIEAHGHPHETDALHTGHKLIGFAHSEPPLGPVWRLSRMERNIGGEDGTMGETEVVFRSSSVRARLAVCLGHGGLAVLPCLVADCEPSLTRVFGPEQIGFLELWLLVRNDMAHVDRVRRIMDFIINTAEAARPALIGHEATAPVYQ
ncbi:MAG: LysR family transcriptional regulator [Parvularculales bacterium]